MTDDFNVSLQLWKEASVRLIEARETYRLRHATLTVESTAKNAEGRKAEADAKTAELRMTRNHLEIDERVAYHQMIHLRGGSDGGSSGSED
jgi:hypothetical protein